MYYKGKESTMPRKRKWTKL